MNIFPFSSKIDPNRSTAFLFGLMLSASLCTQIKLPAVGVGLQNLVVPACGVGILVLHRQCRRRVGKRLRTLLMALAVFSAWAFAASVASPSPTTSLYFWLKYNLLGIGLLAFLVLCADRDRFWFSLRMVHVFLVTLALFGILEVAGPHNPVFLLFRSDMSLTIYPRVASLMAWPNQFGVLMAVGVGLTQLFGARGMLFAPLGHGPHPALPHPGGSVGVA